MLVAGHYYTLKVNRISDYGLYLADEDGNEVLTFSFTLENFRKYEYSI